MTVVAASGDEGRSPAAPMTWGGSVVAALLVVLTRPGAWAIGLAGFLARGGILLVAAPILVLPTPAGLQVMLRGIVSSLVFQGVSGPLVVLAAGLGLAFVAALVAGAFVAAWAERVGIGIALEAGEDEGLVADAPSLDGAPGAGRVAVVRLLGLVPVAAVLVVTAPAIYAAGYRELVLPAELQTPLVIRILAAAPWAFAAIAVTWLVADAAASMGVRRLVLDRRGTLAACGLGWWSLVRHPLAVLGTALVSLGALVACIAPGMLAAVLGWARVREAFLDPRDPLGMGIAVLLWVGVWLGVLVLAGAAAAFRNAAWTYAARRG